MTFYYKNTWQITALLLVICLANTFVFAGSVGNSSSEVLSAGVLKASDASAVRVNGNAAQNGMTILSGAEIKIGKDNEASINLRSLGTVELAAETSVKLVFTADQVDLQILSGQAELTTLKGVRRILTDNAGKISETDSTLDTSSIGNDKTGNADATPPVPVVAANGVFGLGVWGTVAAVGGLISGTMLALTMTTKSETVSQSPISRVRP